MTLLHVRREQKIGATSMTTVMEKLNVVMTDVAVIAVMLVEFTPQVHSHYLLLYSSMKDMF